MVISLGSVPCKYKDCIHYKEDFTEFQYRGLDLRHNANDNTHVKYCSKCKYMIHHIKPSKKKEPEKIDRFSPIKTRIKIDKRLNETWS